MSRIDSVRLRVIWGRLGAIVEEQAVTLLRAGFSSIVNQAGDFSCAVFDGAGTLLSQSAGTPGQLHTLGPVVRHFFRRFPPAELREGDVLITNDPWKQSGHLNDIAIARPIFLKGHLVAIAASCCHAADIGGRGLASDASDVYEEGLQIPILKLFVGGQRNEDLFSILIENVRMPDEFVGDLMAQVSAADVTAAKIEKLLGEFELENLAEVGQAMCTLAENAMRDAIRALPNGTYVDDVYFDGADEPVQLHLALTVEDDSLQLDFTGSSRQVSIGINCVPNYAMAYANFMLKAVLCPELPHNEGTFAPVRYVIPEGTIINPRYPAPVAARHLTGHFTAFAVLGVLARLIPDRVMADSAGGGSAVMQLNGTREDGSPFALLFFNPGGLGARANDDGIPTVSFPPNRWNIPVEVVENILPIAVLEKELLTDSGGPGKFRGGLGQRVVFRLLSGHCWLSGMLERTKYPARGFWGGLPGCTSELAINGETVHPKKRHELFPGDWVVAIAAGGGGFGSPKDRLRSRLLDDVRLGYVSATAAIVDYGLTTEELRSARDAHRD